MAPGAATYAWVNIAQAPPVVESEVYATVAVYELLAESESVSEVGAVPSEETDTVTTTKEFAPGEKLPEVRVPTELPW
jgi:hypothetical protein